jgi:hypothetical protein
MPPRLDDVLSPELVLVDPGLRARARATMVVPHWAPSSVEEPPPEPIVVEPEPPQRRRVAAPVGTLVATAVASLVVSAFSGGEQANGVVGVDGDRAVGSATTLSSSSAQGSRAVLSAPVTSGARSRPATENGATVSESEESPPITSSPSAQESEPTHRLTASATTLVWPRSTQASAYDLELVRDGAVIFAARSSSPQVLLPRSWSRDGVSYAIQPEDQAFVWPVVDGRRRGEAVVNGALALDLTLVSRFVELSRGKAHQ